MKIFSIDSTSSTARIAITEDARVLHEFVHPIGANDWNNMVAGELDFLHDAFMNLIDQAIETIDFKWDDIDYICCSGYSGFKLTTSFGKILAGVLGRVYHKEVVPVDHITSHYFSLFVNKPEEQIFSKLVFSASGSHNSLVYFKKENDLRIFNDDTYYDNEEKKYIGLGSIYNRLLRFLDILKEHQSPREISEVLQTANKEIDTSLTHDFKKLYYSEKLFDFDMYYWYIECKKLMKLKRTTVSPEKLFFSFERALFEIFVEKFDAVVEIMPVKEIAIVGGISQNDSFIEFLESHYKTRGIYISRPLPEFRFDNASMLGTLLYYMKKNNTQYPFSHIIT